MSKEQAPGTAAMLASREKLWTERDVEQKLEALRELVITLSIKLETAQEKLYKMENHLHMPSGQMVAPVVDSSRDGPPRGWPYLPMSLRLKE